MTNQKQRLALRWINDYYFYRQMAGREEDPVRKKYFQDRAKEAKREYDALMLKIGSR